MRTKISFLLLIGLVLMFAGCATTPKPNKIVVWETTNIPRAYEVIGPTSVTVDVAENPEDTVQGIASFISKDGRISDQMPPDMKKMLEIKGQKYKEMIFDKLANKAREYGADAVIGAEYLYVPAYASFSTKATVSAKGMMVVWKQK